MTQTSPLCTLPRMTEQARPSERARVPAARGRAFHVRLGMTGLCFGLVPPFVLSRARTHALRACGVRIGFASTFHGQPRLIGDGPVAGRLTIGDYCGFNDGCLFDLAAPVAIADHVSVGHQVRFLTRELPPGEPRQLDGQELAAPIAVGAGAWIGARCTVLGGVSIGAGAVVGAGVTVAQDVPPNTLWTGAQAVSLARWR